VQRLATAHQVASGGVASASTTIGAGTATLGSGLPALGFSGAVADSALAAGHHALVVTQSSQAATVAAGQWGGTVTVGPANDQLTISVNGQTRVITIADGTYSSITALASAVGAAAGTDVSVTATGGHLNISTVAEGSSATLQVSGGTALTTLGLTVGASATGTDGVVSLDGVSTTVSSVTQGAQLTLPSTGGNLSVTIGGGLRAGGGTVQVLRSGAATTPTSLAADLTTADAGLSTQLVDTGSGANPVRLVVGAKDTGTAKAFTLDLSGYTAMDGATDTLTQGQDAVISLGSLNVSRPTNTVTDLLAGVSLQLSSAQPGTDVTVTVARDQDAIVNKVKAMVDALNAALGKIGDLTKYDPDKKQASVLTGDSRATDLISTLQRAMQAVGSGTLKSLGQIGISFQRDGTYALDETKLRDAMSNDFASVVGLLSRTGTAADTRLSFVNASKDTLGSAAGYGAVITQAAGQATLTGAAFTSLSADDNLAVTYGGTTVNYRALAGATPDAVAAGLNDAFKTARLGVQASVSGGAVVLTTTAFGSSATISVTGGAIGLNGSASGVDVAGTINGVAAVGTGQLLTSTTGASNGLAIKVTATAADVAGAGGSLDLGAMTYSPGATGSLSQTLDRLLGTGGLLTLAHDNAVQESSDTQKRIDDFETRLTSTHDRYVQQFAQLETLMGQLRNQSSWLASQISSLGTGQ